MSEITYYFNTYDVGVNEWATTPGNMVDGATGTYAETNMNDLQLLTANECAGTDLGTISKVEIRAFNYIVNVSRIYVTPVFVAGDGDTHNTNAGFSGAWSSYIDITSDTNAPGSWAWSDIQAMDCKVSSTFDSGNLYVAKVEIMVTYTGVTHPPAMVSGAGAFSAKRLLMASGL